MSLPWLNKVLLLLLLPQYKSIVDHRRAMQTRLAQELHQNANVPFGPCGIEQAKLFQTYLTKYQISIVSKEYENNIIYAGPEKDKKIYPPYAQQSL